MTELIRYPNTSLPQVNGDVRWFRRVLVCDFLVFNHITLFDRLLQNFTECSAGDSLCWISTTAGRRFDANFHFTGWLPSWLTNAFWFCFSCENLQFSRVDNACLEFQYSCKILNTLGLSEKFPYISDLQCNSVFKSIPYLLQCHSYNISVHITSEIFNFCKC